MESKKEKKAEAQGAETSRLMGMTKQTFEKLAKDEKLAEAFWKRSELGFNSNVTMKLAEVDIA